MGLVRQGDFGGGIYRSPRAPSGSLYDAINVLIDGERFPFKRGGNAYKSNTNLATAVLGVADVHLVAGPRTMFWTASKLYVLQAADDATPVEIVAVGHPVPNSAARVVGLGGGIVAFESSSLIEASLYGGSLKAASSTGTITVTLDSRTVTGVGTSWLTATDVGAFLLSVNFYGVVASVDSDTQITLQDAWRGATSAGAGYTVQPLVEVSWSGIPGAGPLSGEVHVASVGSPARLVITGGRRAYFTLAGYPFPVIVSTDFHELGGAVILGATSVRGVLVLFATDGVWAVRNMDLDLTDANGDPQQRLEQISKDVILWHNTGIAALSGHVGLTDYEGQFIVPGRTDVYVMGVDGGPPLAISEGIRPLYRDYVAAGYVTGAASVFRGHYVLPIRTTGDVAVDVLVCRLDQRDRQGRIRPAWTRWADEALSGAFASRSRQNEAPKLLHRYGLRLAEATGCFVPAAGNKLDADGSGFDFDVTTNDLEPPSKSTLQRVRVHYDLVDAAADNPTLSASYAVDAQEGAALTALSGPAPETTTDPKIWRVVKRGRRFRLRLVSSGPSSKLRIRLLEWFVRDSDRP